MFFNNHFRGGVQMPRASIVAEALPGMKDLAFRGASQRRESWESAEPLFIIRQNSGDLGLLQHELGDEDRIGIARAAPWKVATMAAIPAQKSATEIAGVFL